MAHTEHFTGCVLSLGDAATGKSFALVRSAALSVQLSPDSQLGAHPWDDAAPGVLALALAYVNKHASDVTRASMSLSAACFCDSTWHDLLTDSGANECEVRVARPTSLGQGRYQCRKVVPPIPISSLSCSFVSTRLISPPPRGWLTSRSGLYPTRR